MHKRQYLAAACRIVGLLLLIMMIVICLPLAVPRLFGYQTYAIVSGSMEPELPVGSMVYAKAASPETIAAGDIIVFYGGHDSNTVVTHRVVENRQEEKEFVTRGDANTGNDVTPVNYRKLIGKVAFDLPGLGKFMPFFSEPRGRVCLFCFLAAGVLLRVAGRRLQPGFREQQ